MILEKIEKISVKDDLDIKIENLDNSLYENVFEELTVQNLHLHNEFVNVNDKNIQLGECIFNYKKDAN